MNLKMQIRGLAGVVVVVLLAGACGGGGERQAGIDDLLAAGYGEEEAACVVDGVTDAVGSLSRIEDDEVSDEELEAAAAVFVDCAGNASGDEAGPESDDVDGETASPETSGPAEAVATTEAVEPIIEVAQPGVGHWTAAQLCTLGSTSALQAMFDTTNPVVAEEGIDQPTWATCEWEDPDFEFDPAAATPKFMVIKSTPRDESVLPEGEELVDVGLIDPDGAVFREEWAPGFSSLTVFAGDQILEVSWPMEVTGVRAIAVASAQVWAAVQTDETVPSEASESADEATPLADLPSGGSPEFDALRDGCAAGDPDACDFLFLAAPSGSDYGDFGVTCGNRGASDCQGLLGAENGSFDLATAAPDGDPTLMLLWDECASGDGQACSDLYFDSPVGSVYEYYGASCGGQVLWLDCDG